jgi:hypothetical protein
VDAAVNESGQGRHLAYGAAMGVQVHLSKTVRLTPELQFVRDQDPARHATMSRAALSFDVQPAKMLQLDVQATAVEPGYAGCGAGVWGYAEVLRGGSIPRRADINLPDKPAVRGGSVFGFRPKGGHRRGTFPISGADILYRGSDTHVDSTEEALGLCRQHLYHDEKEA